MPDTTQLLDSIRQRKSRSGIVTADRYFREVEGCFDGGFCPTETDGTTEEQWRKSLKAAETKLTYSASEMVVDRKSVTMLNKKSSSSPNWLLKFSARITSTRRDRDRDVLQTKGATIDPHAPFLLHHMHMRPIGKLLKVISHTASEMDGQFAISNTAEGRDGAQLVMDEVLRISHGFEPIEWKAMEDEEGWEFLKFYIYEVSGVAVPSNIDGHILGVDGKSFDSALVRGLQKSMKIVIPPTCTCKSASAHVELPKDVTETERNVAQSETASVALAQLPEYAIVTRYDIQSVNHTKDFDVERQHVEAAKLEYDWISRFCSCEVKQLINLATSTARIRMGSFLTGLKHALADSIEVDARRLTSGGMETPLEYETIQLNSTKSDNFLVEGISFRKMKSTGVCFAVKFVREWSGESVALFSAKKDAQAIDHILDDAWKWSEANNFLKGEAFSLGGEFLPKTSESWGDLFLDPVNESEVKRSVDLLNSKGKACPNRGQVFMGPPGTGKTLSGRLMRNNANATFIWVGGKDAYYYGGVNAVCQAFALAKELAPSIIFMEDIDAALTSSYAIDVLKTEMDGIGRSTGVTTVITTNHPGQFPKALLDRPGRFHDVLKFDLPSEKVRLEMLRKWLPDMTDKARLSAVSQTDGYSGAHVYELCQYSKTLREQDSIEIDVAVEKALKKIADQRTLIDDELMGDRKVASRHRSAETTGHIKTTLFTKSHHAEAAIHETGDSTEPVNEEATPVDFSTIERSYIAALAIADIDTIRRSHKRLSVIANSAEELQEAREWDSLLSQGN